MLLKRFGPRFPDPPSGRCGKSGEAAKQRGASEGGPHDVFVQGERLCYRAEQSALVRQIACWTGDFTDYANSCAIDNRGGQAQTHSAIQQGLQGKSHAIANSGAPRVGPV